MALMDDVRARRDEFEIKDSGEREEYESGMRRDTEDGKLDYTLLFDGPLADRLAEHLTKGRLKYDQERGPFDPPNWMLADSPEEMMRFRRSALRHMRQWLRGDVDEDHAAAIVFNVFAFEYVRERLSSTDTEVTHDR